MLPSCGHLDDAQARPAQRMLPENLLAIQVLNRRQSPVVEDVRRVPAQLRVHPPRPVKKQPGIGGHGRVIAQDVLKRRHASSWRVRDIAGLRELLGIAEQDEGPGRVRDGQDVGE